MITGKNYIGEEQCAMGERFLKTFNPQLNKENPWIFAEATEAEMEQAVLLANQAFNSYRTIPGKERAKFLHAIADEIAALGNSIVEVYCLESGLPKGRAEGERSRTIGQLHSFAEMVEEGSWVQGSIDTAIPNRQPLPKEDIRKMLIPIGPVVVFGAGNFPLAFSTAGGDTASALAAGCPVIVKSHPFHLGTGELIASAIIKAAQKTSMPNGVFSNLNGGTSLGVTLVQHPFIKGVGFTGSTKGGRSLFDLAAQRPQPIPVFAEMGSINPVVVLPQALEKQGAKWASALVGSISLGAGQFCTNPGLLLAIKGSSLTQFEQELVQALEKTAPACMLHPLIKSAFTETKEKLKGQAGVRILFETEEEEESCTILPVLFSVDADAFLQNRKMQQEVFGPFSLLVRCEDHRQLVEVINQLDGQLTGTIISDDRETHVDDVMQAMQNKVGRIVFNGVPTGVEVCASMMHGGPYPASTDSRYTAVGVHAIQRWARPICYQNYPDDFLPPELQDENPLKISRMVDQQQTTQALAICQGKHFFA